MALNLLALHHKLFDNFDPSFRSFDASHLDSGKCLVKFLCCRSHFFHSTWEADFFAMVYDLSNRRDNCCSTAKSAFCEIFYFVQIYFTFFDFQSEIMFCNIYQRTACDGWKNTIGLRCYNGVVLCNKDEVCYLSLQLLFL